MRCRNPDCMRTLRSPSDKTKETRLCGDCRKKIIKESEEKAKMTLNVKPKMTKMMIAKIKATKIKKAELNAIEKFEASLKNNPEYYEFVNMFRDTEKVIVK